MLKYLSLILLVLIIGCGIQNKEEKKSRYSEKQVGSLKLGTTKRLRVVTDSVIKVDLNPFLKKKSFDFGSLIKEVKLTPLETTDESLLDDVLKIHVSDSNIFIYDKFKGGGIVLFERNGKFIRRIPNGKGPGELIRLYDIGFDKHKNELIAYQHSFFSFFTRSGEFIRRVRLPFSFYNFTVVPEGYVFKSLDRQGNEHLGSLKDHTLLITDKNFKLKSAGLPCTPSNINS